MAYIPGAGVLKTLAGFLTYDIIGIRVGESLFDALEFFIYDMLKTLPLLALIIFAVSVVRSHSSPDQTRRVLSYKKEFIRNLICCCSAVPVFVGFVDACVPCGVTRSPLMSALVVAITPGVPILTSLCGS